MPALSEGQLAKVIAALGATPGIAAAWVFGSHARGTARPDSDVDLAVLLAAPSEPGFKQRLAIQAVCADALGLPVERVDLIVLNDAPALLTHAVLREGRLLLNRDQAARVDFEVQALHRFVIAARLRDEAMRERALRLAPEHG